MSNMDINALNWVKKEIDETLSQAGKALEVYTENQDDKAQLQFCATYVHQVYGTLQMLELYGASLLAEEMEHLARGLEAGRVVQVNDAIEVLMRALIQLPDYLENLQKGQKDLPAVLLPLLNDLRAVQGYALLSENSLFTPDLSINVPDSVESRASEIDREDLSAIARKLRTLYQVALLNWYKGNEADANLQRLAEVVKRLREYSSEAFSRKLWWVAEAVIEGLLNKSLLTSVTTKLLLGQVDRQIKRLIDAGEGELQNNPDQNLVKNLLYYVAQERTLGAVVNQVKQTYSLDSMMPKEAELKQARDGISGSNQALMNTVSIAIKEDLANVKDKIDLYLRSAEKKAENLAAIASMLKRISDTLVMVGLGAARNGMQDQIRYLESLLDGEAEIDEARFVDIAGVLLVVESAVDGMASGESKVVASALGDEEPQGTGLSAAEMQGVYSAAIQEVINDIATSKEIVVTYANSPWDHELIQPVPAQFHRIGSTLQVIGQPRCGQVADRIHDYLKQTQDLKNIPDDGHLNHLADAISGLEYYLENYRDTGFGNIDALVLTENALRSLGMEVVVVEPLVAAPLEPKKVAIIREDSSTSMAPAAETAMARKEAPSRDGASLNGEEAFEKQNAPDEVTSEEEHAEKKSTAVVPKLMELPPVMAASEVDEEILEIFIEEADEATGTIREYYPKWRADQSDANAMVEMRRAFHTLKGSGRLVGAMLVGEFSWAFENMLNRVIDKSILVTDSLLELIDQAIEELPSMVDQLRGGPGSTFDLLALMQAAERTSQGEQVRLSDLVASSIESASEAAAPEVVEAIEEEPVLMDPVLFEIFNTESLSHLRVVREFIQQCELNSDNVYVTVALSRALHTLHGSSRMANAPGIVEISSRLEKLARIFETKRQPMLGAFTALLSDSAVAVETLLKVLMKPAESLDQSVLIQRIDKMLAEAQQLENLSGPVVEEHLDEDSFDEEDEVYAHEQEEFAVEMPSTDHEEDDSLETLSVAAPVEDLGADLVDIFLQEAEKIMLSNQKVLGSWMGAVTDLEYPRQLQRNLHTIKGGARMAEIAPIGDLGQALETLFEKVVVEARAVPAESLALVGGAFDALANMLAQIKLRQPLNAAPDIIEQVEQIIGQISAMDAIADLSVTPMELVVESLPPEVPVVIQITEPLVSPPEVSEVDEDDELLGIFIEEGEEILDQADRVMQGWESAPDDASMVKELQRHLHTLKGGARMAGIEAIGDLGHLLESLFEGIVEGTYRASTELFGLLHGTFDTLHKMLGKVKAGQPVEQASAMLQRLEAYMQPAGESYQPAEIPLPMRPAESHSIDFGVADQEPEEEVDEELLDIFLEEGDEIMDTSDRVMQKWEADPSNKEYVKELQRHLHTLKGGARLSQLNAIGDLGHVLEFLFEGIANDTLAPNAEMFSAVHGSLDRLHKMLGQARARKPVEAAPDLVARIELMLGGAPAEETAEELIPVAAATQKPAAKVHTLPTEAPIPLPTRPRIDTFDDIFALPSIGDQMQAREDRAAAAKANQEVIRVRADLLDNLVNYAGEVSIYRARLEQEIGGFKFNLDELDQTVVRIKEQLRRLEMETESQIVSTYQQVTGKILDSDFDALEMDQYSQIQQLSRALAESMNDLGSVQGMLESITGQAEVLLVQQSRVNTELQEGLMRTRMLPFASVIPRLRRLVRQVGDELGKSVSLRAVGSEGEIDRTVLDRITAPLEHMIRNSIAHGLENPQGRRDKAKEEEGKILIRMYREGGEVVIQVADDGAGIDIDAVRKKAISQGLLKADARISDHEAIQFIFESGFSTATEVSQVAGRGVGMDVVHSEVKQLGGSLDIDTRKDKGTTFTIRLPFTLSVSQALLVQVVDETYAIPLTSIQGVVRMGRRDLEEIYQMEYPFLEYGGNRYEVQHLGRLLGLVREPRLPEGREKAAVLLVRVGDHFAAYQVEGLLGGREIVVKSMGVQLSTVRGISGATILGDGSVVLIIDMGTLVRLGTALAEQIREEVVVEEVVIERRATKVMVVDDSITVRKVTTRLLHRHEMEVIAAKDGLEAVTMLQDMEQLPDVMLLDIEMPRMDGYEVASHVRSNPRLKHIPIIMITSRTGDKHRDKAMKIGVDRYLGKPFQENILLAEIESVTANLMVH